MKIQIHAEAPVTGLTEVEVEGLLLSLFTTIMKSSKMNSDAPFTHFMRERLKTRADRAALNVILNALAKQIAKGNPQFSGVKRDRDGQKIKSKEAASNGKIVGSTEKGGQVESKSPPRSRLVEILTDNRKAK